MSLNGTDIAVARFLAAGHRLCRFGESGPWFWLRPGQEPPDAPPRHPNGHVHARIVSDLVTSGLAEGTASTTPQGRPYRLIEATRTCVDRLGTELSKPKR